MLFWYSTVPSPPCQCLVHVGTSLSIESGGAHHKHQQPRILLNCVLPFMLFLQPCWFLLLVGVLLCFLCSQILLLLKDHVRIVCSVRPCMLGICTVISIEFYAHRKSLDFLSTNRPTLKYCPSFTTEVVFVSVALVAKPRVASQYHFNEKPQMHGITPCHRGDYFCTARYREHTTNSTFGGIGKNIGQQYCWCSLMWLMPLRSLSNCDYELNFYSLWSVILATLCST